MGKFITICKRANQALQLTMGLIEKTMANSSSKLGLTGPLAVSLTMVMAATVLLTPPSLASIASEQSACRGMGGRSRSINLFSPTDASFIEQAVFCQFGSTLIDGITVIGKQDGELSFALLSYKNDIDGTIISCDDASALQLTGQDPPPEPHPGAIRYDPSSPIYIFCKFDDGSAIDLWTLTRGYRANPSFNRALGL